MGLEDFNKISLQAERPLLCIEVNPPRGVDIEPILKRLEGVVDGVSFFNVTDSALARMKQAAFPFSYLLKQRFNIEPMVNLSCRDRNLIALQGDILGAWALGIKSVVALTGDAVTVGDSPDRKGVFEVNSIGLLQTIATLNSGRDLAGGELKGAPSMIPGVVVNPNARNTAAELKRLARKKDAGATYALSQPVFDLNHAKEFFSEAQKIGIPIFVGLLPFKNAKSAHGFTKIPGIRLSDQLITTLEKSGDQDLSSYSINHCLEIAAGCRGLVAGYHVICGSNMKLALELLRELAGYVRSI